MEEVSKGILQTCKVSFFMIELIDYGILCPKLEKKYERIII